MNGIRAALNRLLRGPAASSLLARFGIDPRRFWLLMDLLGQLSDTGEMSDQLGLNASALKVTGWLYFAVSALMGLAMLATHPRPAEYSSLFLFMTGILLLIILVSEAANSLVNPAEALVLAHQPINGATYIAAKLAHLLRIVLFLVPGLNAVPAVAGTLLPGAPWYFAIRHLAAAFGVGIVAGLLCCALFGWLIRFMPAGRLKSAAQIVGLIPFLGMMYMRKAYGSLTRVLASDWMPAGPVARGALAAAAGATAVAVVVLGIRSLSVDYLIRVSGIMRGGGAPGAKSRRSPMGSLVALAFGGQPGRAGFAYVSRMMLRDFQFRRAAMGIIPMLLLPLLSLGKGLRTDLFDGKFTPMHVVPHLFGGMLFIVCSVIPFGADYKGVWVFLTAPSRVLCGFVRGVYGLLWISMVLIPNSIILAVLCWFWGLWHAGLFAAYGVAVGSMYLALEFRMIDGVPFGRQIDPKRNAATLPIMGMGAVAISIVVGLQYVLLFHSPWRVALATAVFGSAAYFLTRAALRTVEGKIRYSLGQLTQETGRLYKEVEA